MTPTRPTSMTVVCVLNFVFGGVGCAFGLFRVFFGVTSLVTMALNKNSDFTPSEMIHSTVAFGIYGIITGAANIVVGILAVVSGVGLKRVANWGRGWTLAYALTMIAGCAFAFIATAVYFGFFLPQPNPSSDVDPKITRLILIGGAAATEVILCVYPVVLLFLLRSKKWKMAVTNRDANA